MIAALLTIFFCIVLIRNLSKEFPDEEEFESDEEFDNFQNECWWDIFGPIISIIAINVIQMLMSIL